MSQTAAAVVPTETDGKYHAWLDTFQRRFTEKAGSVLTLFKTDTEELFTQFLQALPEEYRQHYTCHACRSFVNRYGGVVVISSEGQQEPVFWDMADLAIVPEELQEAVKAMYTAVKNATVLGPFYSEEKVWGLPVTGTWRHIAVRRDPKSVFKGNVLKNAEQAMAEKLEDYRILQSALDKYSEQDAAVVAQLLKSGDLFRADKHTAAADWFLNLYQVRKEKNHTARRNQLWVAVATAPAGWCHVNSGMLGVLLDGVANKEPIQDIKHSYDVKMNPLKYQRPQALPSAGNLAQAEKVVEALKSEGALRRRDARMEDIQEFVWRPAAKEEKAPVSSVFGHLKTKEEKKVEVTPSIPPVAITWEKFKRTVLPDAVSMSVLPSSGSYYAFTAACDQEAPPIFQWDFLGKRNSVSWYTTGSASMVSRWYKDGKAPAKAEVTAVIQFPHEWNGAAPLSNSRGVLFAVKGGYPNTNERELALFPELLKAEYRPVRASIEAFSKAGKLERSEEPVVGLALRTNHFAKVHVYVVNKHGITSGFIIDRWD